jgi:hypothetical protein
MGKPGQSPDEDKTISEDERLNMAGQEASSKFQASGRTRDRGYPLGSILGLIGA